MANIVFGFGCGIAYMFLLKKLKTSRNKKFKFGEDEVCHNCKFYKLVIDSLDEVDYNADCNN